MWPWSLGSLPSCIRCPTADRGGACSKAALLALRAQEPQAGLASACSRTRPQPPSRTLGRERGKREASGCTCLSLWWFCPQNPGARRGPTRVTPGPRAGRGRGGHRPTLWQVPGACNLLRHLKKTDWKCYLRKVRTPHVTVAVARRGAHGEAGRLWALPGEATAMFLVSWGRRCIPLCLLRPFSLQTLQTRPPEGTESSSLSGLLATELAIISVRTTRKRGGPSERTVLAKAASNNEKPGQRH